jgi:hypothetical protein
MVTQYSTREHKEHQRAPHENWITLTLDVVVVVLSIYFYALFAFLLQETIQNCSITFWGGCRRGMLLLLVLTRTNVFLVGVFVVLCHIMASQFHVSGQKLMNQTDVDTNTSIFVTSLRGWGWPRRPHYCHWCWEWPKAIAAIPVYLPSSKWPLRYFSTHLDSHLQNWKLAIFVHIGIGKVGELFSNQCNQGNPLF